MSSKRAEGSAAELLSAVKTAADRDILPAIADHIPGLISYIGADGRYRFVNKAYENWFAVPRETILGMHHRELLGEAAYRRLKPYVEKVMSGQAVTFETALDYPGSGSRWVTITDVPDVDKRGEVRGFYVLVTDITDRKRAEEAVVESERRYRNLVEGSLQGILIHRDYRPLFVNQALVEMLGYASVEEVTAMPSVEPMIAPHERARIRKYANARKRNEDVPTQYEVEALRKDGRRIVFQNAVRLVDWEGQRAVQSTLIDVTERKRAEDSRKHAYDELEQHVRARTRDLSQANSRLQAEVAERKRAESALQENQRALSTLLSNLPGMAYRCRIDDDWTMEFVSEGCLELTGYPPAELIGNRKISYRQISFADEGSIRRNAVTAALREHRSFQLVYGLITADGAEKWVWEQGRGVYGADGEAVAMEGFIADITERRRAEREQRDSENRLQLALEATTAIIWEWNLSTGELSYRATPEHPDPASSRPRNIDARRALIHPEDLPRTLAAQQAHLSGHGDRYECEFRVRTASGEWRWNCERGKFVPGDAGGQPPRIVGTDVDVTTRNQAQTALRESEERFRDFAQAAADWFWEMCPDLRFTYMEGRFEEVTGLSREQLLGRTRMELIEEFGSEPDPTPRIEEHRKVLEARQPFSGLEVPWRHPEGRLQTLRINGKPLFADDGTFRGYRGTVRDITDEKRAEELVRENEQRFRDLVEGSVQGTLIHRDWRPLFVNQAYAETLGYDSVDEILRLDSVLSLFAPYERSRLNSFKEARERGKHAPGYYEYDALRKDGSVITMQNAVRVVTWRGEPAIQSTTVDISERKRAEEQLRKHQATLAHMARLHTMGEMASGMAHELNQPLSAIVSYAAGCTRRLQSGNADTDELLAAMEHVAAHAKHAGEVIRSLRSFVRRDDSRKEHVNINDLVRDVEPLLRPETRQAAVQLQVNLDPDLPEVNADPIQIEQVLLNLSRNAVEAMETMSDGPRDLIIETAVNGETHHLEVSVTDTGPGVPLDDGFGQLFEPFFTTKSQGLGMGLSISRSILEAHGGILKAEAGQERGAIFRFSLPLERL